LRTCSSSLEKISTPYAEIDDAIENWVERNGLTLCREWQGEARFWYTARLAESFQIAVDPPVDGMVSVHAWSVETDDNAELHGEWSVGVVNLERALATATKLIDLWSRRDRMVT
jgi:hypothetical protein